jgi:hypothetical protein
VTKVGDATTWLRRSLMAEGSWMPAARGLAEGAARGWDADTMLAARKRAGIVSEFRGGFGPDGGRWIWIRDPVRAEAREPGRHVQGRGQRRRRKPEPLPEIGPEAEPAPLRSGPVDRRAIVGGMAACPSCGRMQIAKPMPSNVCISLGCNGVIPVR